MTNKVLIIDEVHSSLSDGLQKLGYDVDELPKITPLEVGSIISDYVGLVIRSKMPLDKTFLVLADQLKFIARAGAGLDLIDLAYCQTKNIAVFSANEGNKDAVAEHVMGQLLSLAHKLNQADQEIRNGVWNRESNRGFEIHGKTVGIIGFGNMGQALATRLSGFGTRIMAFDKYRDSEPYSASLEEIFEHADIVSIHVPLTEETAGMVDIPFLSKFKKPILLINSSRGGICPLEPIAWGLSNGKIKGLALDVLPNEKLAQWTPIEQQLFKAIAAYPATIFSPHVAGWTMESYKKINLVLIEKIKMHFNT